MTPRQMQSAFEQEASRFDSDIMLESNVIFYWLNEAQDRFFKTRYSKEGDGFEQTQKRTDDLRTLVVSSTLTATAGTNTPNSYLVELPSDYVLCVGEEANISFTYDSTDYNELVEVHPITSDEYTKEVNSPFGKHKLHYETATPLRLTIGNNVELISDGNYNIDSYVLRYIKQPTEITLNGIDCELPNHTHSEIVTNAVSLVLENLQDPRYQSFKSESLEQE